MRVIISGWTHNRRGVAVTGEIIAIGDVHGRLRALSALLGAIGALPRDPAGREVIFTGDLIDRGPAGLACVDAAFAARILCDRLTVLPGNHELMLAAAVDNLTSLAYPEALGLWLINGGTAVVDEADPDDVLSLRERLSAIAKRIETAAAAAGFPDWLGSAPGHARRGATSNGAAPGDILFVHAGIAPGIDVDRFLAQPRLAHYSRHWAWIREPFLDSEGGFDEAGVALVVHGHTPALPRLGGFGGPALDGPREIAPAVARLDRSALCGRICIDAGAAFCDQVAAVQFAGDRHRFLLAVG